MILYADDRGGAANVWSQPFAGGEPKQLTEFTSDNIYSFDRSRDGRQLAVARGSVSSDVVVMSLADRLFRSVPSKQEH